MLGALTKITGIVKESTIEKAIIDSAPENSIGANIKGLRKGFKFGAVLL
jgi:Pyruvate/2-oxoacid:ferredoxin oxidoreductase gamma subunit